MDPQHPQREVGASAPADGAAAATLEARAPAGIADQRSLPSPSPSDWITPSGVVKDAIVGATHRGPVPEDDLVRDSWVSIASTAASRDSGVPSIFSSVRASTASSSTRYSVRQSLIDSPAPTSPMYHHHRKGSLPQSPHYCCTFCDAAFDTKTEWKLHELEFHDRRERYICGSCPAIFPRAALMAEHFKAEHGLNPTTGPTHAVEYSCIRSAWGCGFCAAVVLSRNSYLEHVGKHYDEGKLKSEWQHTRVIEGLLRQPKIDVAWTALVGREEHARGVKLRFLWDPITTGRAPDGNESHSLQDILEFFATGTRAPDHVAAEALSSAHIRPEGNVSDLISRLYLRNPTPQPAKPAKDATQLSPGLQPYSPESTDDVVSPISPLPEPLRSPTAPPRFSYPRPSPLDLFPSTIPPNHVPEAQEPMLQITPAVGGSMAFAGASGAPSASGLRAAGRPTVAQSFKHRTLRRVESARSLEPSGSSAGFQTLHKPMGVTPRIPSSGLLPVSNRSTGLPLLRFPATPTEPSSVGADGSHPSTTETSTVSSVRLHASSSTLSTFTGCDSRTSETLSDDSLSEPDSWPEVEGIPAATKAWKIAFNQALSRGMRKLWAQYNNDWDALITRCVSENGSDSQQYREYSGGLHSGASSRYRLGGGLRPNALSGSQEDEEHDDEGEARRPPSSLSKRSSESSKRFACPFRKHDPRQYNIVDHEVCTIRSWSTISRLKEHLYRRHYKTHCQRCKQTFNGARELADHEMSVVACEVLDTIPPSDITTYQEKQLKSRKHTTRRQSDEDKWRDIYRLLFSDGEIPSPYPEPAEDMGPMSSDSHANLNFQHFLLSEMPGLFNKTAEEHAGRHLQRHEGLSMEAIPRILEDALHKAFRAWEAGGTKLPTPAASVASVGFLAEAGNSLAITYGQPAAYQSPQPTAAPGHGFAGRNFSATDFNPNVPHTSHADDSGFGGDTFFTSDPSVGFSTFAPQFERGNWEAGLGLMGDGPFGGNSNMGGHYRGFQNG